jgi:hypothetical protein
MSRYQIQCAEQDSANKETTMKMVKPEITETEAGMDDELPSIEPTARNRRSGF